MAAPADDLQLDDQLCFALYSATAAITRAYRPLLAAIGLTYPQYLVMVVLWEGDDRTVGEVAARLAQPAHGIGPLLARLDDLGVVARSRGVDRRQVRVRLTPAGRRLEVEASAAQHMVACATGLDPDQLSLLRGQLQLLTRRLAPTHPTDHQGAPP